MYIEMNLYIYAYIRDRWLRTLQPRGVMERGYDRLNFHIVENGMDAMLAPDAAHPIATKRHCRIEDMVAVDPHCSCLDRSRQPVSHVQILGHNPRRQAIVCVIRSFYNLLQAPI